MITKLTGLVMAGMVVTILSSTPAFAATTLLSDDAMDLVSGNANDNVFNGNSTRNVSLGGHANANIQFESFQWSDEHSTDQSLNKGSNNQSGSASQVQQYLKGQANALFVGSVSQSVLINRGGSVKGGQSNISYAVVASGGF